VIGAVLPLLLWGGGALTGQRQLLLHDAHSATFRTTAPLTPLLRARF